MMREILTKHRNAMVIGLAVVMLMSVTVGCESKSGDPGSGGAGEGAASPGQAAAGRAGSGQASGASWSSTRHVEIADPQYQMTAYTMDVPSGWKFAGAIVRPGGCHANGAGLSYTVQSPDGVTAIVGLPGVAWTWNTSEQKRKFMEQSHCPGIDIDSASSFLVNIAVPNLHPHAKVVSVQQLLPEGQAALAKQLEQMKQSNATMAAQYGQQPQKLTLDGARVRVQYERDGKQIEEQIVSVVNCTTSKQMAMFNQPAAEQRMCTSRGTWITRTSQGQLDTFLARSEVKALGKTLTINHEWDNKLAADMQAKFNQFQAQNNAQFQANLKANQAQFDQRIQQQKQFDANLRQSTDRAIAQDRARQAAIDNSAHQTALYSLDRQEFKNPNTGQTIEASSQYNHQWISSDGSTLIQTNDHGYDPNGQVYPVSQSWSELVPK
jgi:hypothetical protein